MSRYNIMFDGKPMPNFMKVVKVDNMILPTISQNTMSIPGRIGAYYFGNEIGTRQIDVEVIIFASKKNELPKYARQVAAWLYHDEPKKIEFSDNRGYYYYASFTGTSSIEELSRIGRATLSFICYDPLLYGRESVTMLNRGGQHVIGNLGTAPAFPIISMVATTDLTGFNVISKDEYIGVGKGLDVQESPKPKDPYVLNEKFVSLNAWTQAPSLAGRGVSIDLQKSAWEIYEGTIARINEESWKNTGSEWHGGGLERDWGSPTQDFEFVAPIRFDASKPRSRGMIQTNLKDSSNRLLMSIKYVDGSIDSSNLKITVSLYTTSGEERVVYSYETYNNIDFVGCVRVKRTSTRWDISLEMSSGHTGRDEVDFGKWQTSGGLRQVDSNFFVDTKSVYNTPVQKAQIGILMWGNYIEGKPPKEHQEEVLEEGRNTMLIYNVFVKSLSLESPESLPNHTSQYIIYNGDNIVVNCEEGAIYRNGQYFMNYLSPKSTFLKLSEASNSIRIDPVNGFKDITVSFTPKWY